MKTTFKFEKAFSYIAEDADLSQVDMIEREGLFLIQSLEELSRILVKS